MAEPLTHDRFNQAVIAHLAVAMEAQDALAHVVNLSAPYQADIGAGRLDIGGRPLRVLLLGTVSKQSNTWLWSWANQGFSPDVAAIAPVRAVAAKAQQWGLWELGEPVFGLDGVVDTGLGAGASVALLAAPIVGAVGMYAADYGAGVAYFGIVDPACPRPASDAVTFPRRILSAVDLMPGHARAQILTYAAVHDLPVKGAGTSLRVSLPPQDVITVEFDDLDRPVRFSGAIQPRPPQ